VSEGKNIQLRSHRFRAERESSWLQLEDLLERVEKGGPKRLTDAQLIALPRLYRSTLSSLSMARSISLDRELITYLEGLTTRAYFFVYGTRSHMLKRISDFFAYDWPQSVQKLGRETFASLLITVLTAISAYLLVMHNSDWFYSFMSSDMSSGRNPDASAEFLRNGLYEGSWKDGLSTFATFLFTHNAQIGIFAFALGFAFGIPTFILLAYNGFTLGAFVAVYVPKGLGFEIIGWLMIHGTTELFAIILAGAAGFHIGWRIAFPGDLSRLDAATNAGKTAANVVIGVDIMLSIAGLLEGFGRQLVKDDIMRYVIAAGMLCLWLGYFYLPRAHTRSQ